MRRSPRVCTFIRIIIDNLIVALAIVEFQRLASYTRTHSVGGRAQRVMGAKISDQDIAKVATKIQNWKHLSPFLDLNDVDQKEIENYSRGDYLEEKRAALCKWRQKGGKRATYEALIDAAREADNEDLAEYVQSLAQGSSNKRPRLTQNGAQANKGLGEFTASFYNSS